MDGAIGWSFGGYIDIGTAKLRVFAGSDEDLEVESEASEALAPEGGACSRLRAGGGGGWDLGSGSGEVEGPSPFIAGKNRYLRLVKEAVEIKPVEDRGDGIRRRAVEETKFEELYALSGSKLVLFKTTTYSVNSSEEELPAQ